MNFATGNIEVRKTVTDAGYVAVGIGVLAFQQAQVRRRDLQKRLGSTGGCLNARAIDGKARLDTLQQTVDELTQDLRARIEPVVGQVVEQVKTVVTRAA